MCKGGKLKFKYLKHHLPAAFSRGAVTAAPEAGPGGEEAMPVTSQEQLPGVPSGATAIPMTPVRRR